MDIRDYVAHDWADPTRPGQLVTREMAEVEAQGGTYSAEEWAEFEAECARLDGLPSTATLADLLDAMRRETEPSE